MADEAAGQCKESLSSSRTVRAAAVAVEESNPGLGRWGWRTENPVPNLAMFTLPITAMTIQLIDAANQCLQGHNLEIRLGISLPESKFQQSYGSLTSYNSGDEIDAVFQVWEAETLLFTHSNWLGLLQQIEREFGSRFMATCKLDQLKFNRKDDDCDY